jgi:hypothetical protein
MHIRGIDWGRRRLRSLPEGRRTRRVRKRRRRNEEGKGLTFIV